MLKKFQTNDIDCDYNLILDNIQFRYNIIMLRIIHKNTI